MSVERHLRIVTCPSGVLGDSSATELRSGPRRVPGGVWDPSHCASVSWFSFLPSLQCELLRPQGSLVRSQEEKKKHQVTILNAVLQNFYLEIISRGCILLRTGASHHLTERLIPDVFPSSFLKKSSISRHRDLGCPKHVSRKFTALYSKSGLSESWSLLL